MYLLLFYCIIKPSLEGVHPLHLRAGPKPG